MIIPNIWENKKCSKPPTSCWLATLTPHYISEQPNNYLGTGYHHHAESIERIRKITAFCETHIYKNHANCVKVCKIDWTTQSFKILEITEITNQQHSGCVVWEQQPCEQCSKPAGVPPNNWLVKKRFPIHELWSSTITKAQYHPRIDYEATIICIYLSRTLVYPNHG